MKDTRVAKRYAAALFDVAKRDGIVDAIAEDLMAIERLLKESVRLREIFVQPLVTEDRKIEMISHVFGDRITATSLNFLKLLIRKRRVNLIDETIDEFRDLLSEHLNIVSATASTAVPLTADQVKRLTKSLETLTQKTVNLTTEVDADMIGGVVVRIGDYVIDGSVRSQLHRLEQHLLGTK